MIPSRFVRQLLLMLCLSIAAGCAIAMYQQVATAKADFDNLKPVSSMGTAGKYHSGNQGRCGWSLHIGQDDLDGVRVA